MEQTPQPKKEKYVGLMVCVPTLDHIQTATVSSLFMLSNTLTVPAKIRISESSLVHDSRNRLIGEALSDPDITHILFIDSDMEFAGDSANRLLAHDLDIVGGLYFRKRAPHTPNVTFEEGGKLTIPRALPENKLFEAFGVGAGFLLVKKTVFEKIPKPWFYFGQYKGKSLGEDIYFCWRAGKHGFKTYVDPTLQLAHVGTYSYDRKDYQAYLDNKPEDDPSEFWGEDEASS